MFFVVLTACPVLAGTSTIYSNGYYKYTVEDHSVTIVSYRGKESEVRVPNMIAGNPVNVIGKGVFAGNKDVTVIYLPDTIMNVEEGAFGQDQKVNYDTGETGRGDGHRDNNNGGGGNTSGNDDNQSKDNMTKDADNNDAANKPGNNNREDNKDNTDIITATESGINENIPFVTVDNENNLIYVDKNGNETVLDDSRDYKSGTDSNGNEVIKDISGTPVTVNDDGTVEYTDKDNNKVKLDTKTGNKTVRSSDGSFGYEEAQIDTTSPEEGSEENKKIKAGSDADARKTGDGHSDEDTGRIEDKDSVKDGNSIKDRDAGKKTVSSNSGSTEGPEVKADELPKATMIVIAVAVVAVAGLVLFGRKKEKDGH